MECARHSSKRRTLFTLAVALLALGHAWAGSAFHGDLDDPVALDGHSVVRVTARTPEQADAIVALTGDVWTHGYGVGTFDVRIGPGDAALLDRLGVEYTVLIPDVQALIDAERAANDAARREAAERVRPGGPGGPIAGDEWFQLYHPIDEINQQLDNLAAQYPGLAEVFVLPNATHEGRDVHGIRVTGRGSRAVRPAVLINGCQHAREWISPATVMYVLTHLLEDYASDPAVRRIVDGTEFIIIPVVNPDGYVHTWTTYRLWRKNRRDNGGGVFGVDLNRNWGYQWGGEGASTDPRSDLYRGPARFSEPEDVAVRDLVNGNPRIAAHIDFHSYGQLLLYPWAYTPSPSPDAALYTQLSAMLRDAIRAVNNVAYRPGQWYQTLYPSSGVMIDWMYGQHGIWSWTFELRDTGQFGFILPPDQILPTARENLPAVRSLAEWVGPIVPGDLNCDTSLNAFDIEPFVLALFDPAEYASQHPDCDVTQADVNFDGNVDAFDVEPFTTLLFGP